MAQRKLYSCGYIQIYKIIHVLSTFTPTCLQRQRPNSWSSIFPRRVQHAEKILISSNKKKWNTNGFVPNITFGGYGRFFMTNQNIKEFEQTNMVHTDSKAYHFGGTIISLLLNILSIFIDTEVMMTTKIRRKTHNLWKLFFWLKAHNAWSRRNDIFCK